MRHTFFFFFSNLNISYYIYHLAVVWLTGHIAFWLAMAATTTCIFHHHLSSAVGYGSFHAREFGFVGSNSRTHLVNSKPKESPSIRYFNSHSVSAYRLHV